ncbi:MAG: hypothetical protein ABIO44_14280 [Saprospiraceae bacterium]
MCFKHHSNDCIILDSNYLHRLKKLIIDSIDLHDLYQPLQVLVFMKGKLVSSSCNCNAPSSGIFNLAWNKNKAFEVFPPVPNCKMNNEISLEEYTNLINSTKIYSNTSVVFVVWTNAFKKKSEQLLNIVNTNISKYNPSSALVLVNIDNIFITSTN